MSERKQIRETVYLHDGYSSWIDESLGDFMARLIAAGEEIPAEHKSRAKIEIRARSDYDGCSELEIEIYYHRPETDEDIRLREQKAADERARYQAEQERRERAMLATLKARYEGS